YKGDGFDARAVAVFKQILNLDPKRYSAFVSLAELYQRMGLDAEALGALQSAADGYHKEGQKHEALDLLRKMATLDPTNTTSRIKVADLLRQEELLSEAVTEYDAATAELERQGVIDDANIFVVGVIVNGKKGAMKAGEYAIPAGASMARVMAILSEGKAIQFKVTIAEGLTSAQVVEILNAREDLTGAIKKIPEEGSLLPETYSYPRRTPRQEIINQMMRAQATVLEDLWASRAPGLPLKTPREAVILASIVEKETGKSGERRQVASVFVNRLKRNMRLQSDPTIIYGITGGKALLDRPIFQSDIDKPTPYNTYQINGLPPTPIANPGRAALEATLDPASTNYLFFVADGTGGHAFAVTLAEHTSNVARWRQIERRDRLDQEKKAAAEASGGTAPSQGGSTIETQTKELVLPGQ
ncbi:MAG: endolytic transglycosylase MltG, partial [Halocynthiibacter sp.]